MGEDRFLMWQLFLCVLSFVILPWQLNVLFVVISWRTWHRRKAECISFPKMYRFVYVPQLYNKQQHYILTTLVFVISRSILTLILISYLNLIVVICYYNFTVQRHEQRWCWNCGIEKINIIIIIIFSHQTWSGEFNVSRAFFPRWTESSNTPIEAGSSAAN